MAINNRVNKDDAIVLWFCHYNEFSLWGTLVVGVTQWIHRIRCSVFSTEKQVLWEENNFSVWGVQGCHGQGKVYFFQGRGKVREILNSILRSLRGQGSLLLARHQVWEEGPLLAKVMSLQKIPQRNWFIWLRSRIYWLRFCLWWSVKTQRRNSPARRFSSLPMGGNPGVYTCLFCH